MNTAASSQNWMSLAVIHESVLLFTKKEAKCNSSSTDHFGSTLSCGCSSKKHRTQPFCLQVHGFGLALGESSKRRPTSDATVSTFTAQTLSGGVYRRKSVHTVSLFGLIFIFRSCTQLLSRSLSRFSPSGHLLLSRTPEIAWCSRDAPKILTLHLTLKITAADYCLAVLVS